MSFATMKVRQKWRELAALAPGEPVPSPCNSICRIAQASGLCEGCLRSIDEIAVWSRLDDAGKRAVWARIELRLQETP